MTHEPDEHSLERFNPLVELKGLTAQLDDEPSVDRHLGVLPLEWLTQEIFQKSVTQDKDDPRLIVISFLTKDPRPEAYHVLGCEPCIEAILVFEELYRLPQLPGPTN